MQNLLKRRKKMKKNGKTFIKRVAGATIGVRANDALQNVFGTGRVKIGGGLIAAGQGAKMFDKKKVK